MVQTIIEWLERALHLTPDLEIKIISTVIILVLLWLFRLMVVQLINHQIKDLRHQYHWRKTAAYLIGMLSLFLVGRTWLSGIESIITYLGLVSAGVAIALQKPLTSMAAWIYIVSQRPFEVGDRIQLGTYSGDVIDIGPLKFTLLEIGNWVEADQSTGRIMYVPNGEIFSLPLANYTTGLNYIWHEIEVRITFESNWEKAKTLLQHIVNHRAPNARQMARERLRKASRRFMIYYHKLTPIVYTRVTEYGITMTLRYLCPPRRRRSVEEAIWEDVLRAFGEHSDIEFAYPTQRFFQRHVEKHNIHVAAIDDVDAIDPITGNGSQGG